MYWPWWCSWNWLACLHFPCMAAPGINKGGVSLWCGVWPFVVWLHFHVGGWNFEEILQHLTGKKTLERFSSSLNVMVGSLCVQSLPEWAWMFVSVLERQRAILEDRYHHTVVWQRYCSKVTLGPANFYASGNVCNLASILGAKTRSRFVEVSNSLAWRWAEKA